MGDHLVMRRLICTFLTRHDTDKNRREFVWAVKNCREIRYGNFRGRDGRDVAVELLRKREPQLREYLRGAILVPLPASGAGVNAPGDDLWSAKDLATMLAREYGVRSRELLRRHTPVEKSSSSGVRNLRRHFDSIELVGSMPGDPIVLIDDVVTSGSTMCGCAEVLLAADPAAQIKGLAVAYTPLPDELLRNFAAREYEWSSLDERPRNRLVDSPLA